MVEEVTGRAVNGELQFPCLSRNCSAGGQRKVGQLFSLLGRLVFVLATPGF